MERRVLRVPDDADDLKAVALPFEREPPTERSTVAKVVARECLIDDRDSRAMLVRGGEVAAFQNWCPHDCEIVGCDPVERDISAILGRLLEARHGHEPQCLTGIDRRNGAQGRGRDTGNRLQATEERLVEWCQLRWCQAA